MLLWKKVPGRNLANCSQQSRRGAECKGGWESYFSVKINGKNRCNEHVLEFKQRHKKGKGGGGEGKEERGGEGREGEKGEGREEAGKERKGEGGERGREAEYGNEREGPGHIKAC